MALLAMYDLTISAEKFTKEEVENALKGSCKRWVFQKERGEETGYEHYQCRISFTSKKRISTAINWFNEHFPKGGRISPTSNPTAKTGNEFYVTKEDTRIEGPWNSEMNILYIPKRFRGEVTFRGWQKDFIEKLEPEPDDRTVNYILDWDGCNGKSWIVGYLECHGKAEVIPQMESAEKIMGMVFGMPKNKVYFIDLPRGSSKKSEIAMYSAIETIKAGRCYDWRYKFRKEIFEPPHVWVFTNKEPNMKLLTKDRWRGWAIRHDKLMPIIKIK